MTSEHAAKPVRYVVLDSALQRADPLRFERLLSGFAAGYASMFHGDEAEPSARWPARIAGEPPPQPILRIVVAVQVDGPEERAIGGAAVEYYRASACALCTYLYVLDRPEYRQRGHARALVAAAAEAVVPLGRMEALLAEVEWPDALPSAVFSPAEVAAARARLRFFERLGARRIALDYAQPALSPTAQPVPWLRLLWLPAAAASGLPDAARLRGALDRFLPEFHAALAADGERPVDTVLLAAQRAQVASADPLVVGLDSASEAAGRDGSDPA